MGDTKVLGLRLNGSDLTEDGLQPEDAVRVAQLAEATGVLDYVSVSAGTSRDNYMIVPPMDQPAMPYVQLASAIRSAIDLPVFAVGRIKHPSHAASVIADGHADVVAMARALDSGRQIGETWSGKIRLGSDRVSAATRDARASSKRCGPSRAR